MKEINGCEPAFPCLVHNISDAPIEVSGYTVEPDAVVQFGGLSKRDYFAAKALTMVGAANTQQDLATWDYRHFADYAYRMADAMIAEGSK